jgi:hypothetical protein
VDIIDYKSPHETARIRWGRRYAIFGATIGICYFAILIAITCVFEDVNLPLGLVSILHIAIPVIRFPLLTFFHKDLGPGTLPLWISNAMLWGLIPVAIWHLTSMVFSYISDRG